LLVARSFEARGQLEQGLMAWPTTGRCGLVSDGLSKVNCREVVCLQQSGLFIAAECRTCLRQSTLFAAPECSTLLKQSALLVAPECSTLLKQSEAASNS
jgi:hypothetical protein